MTPYDYAMLGWWAVGGLLVIIFVGLLLVDD